MSRNVYFLTGGSRGIGAGVVHDLVRAGHDVAFTYRARAELADQVVDAARELDSDARVRAYQLDVTDSVRVDEVGAQVSEDFGDVHAVVCNAASNRPGLAVSMSDEDWHHVVQTNLTGSFYVARHFLQEFLIQGAGRFVFISSIAARGMAGQVSYCASKAGLMGLSSGIAKEYGPKGVTSNVLELGFFDTDMTREQMSQFNKDFWMSFCPSRRMGELSEVSAAILYLTSEHAGFVNGHALSITGGLDWAG